MMTFLLIVHVIVCFVLIFVVLLQAGRGGGFSEMVGGGQPQSIFGTQTNAFMTRATEVSAVLFIVTSLSLGIMTSQQSKSLVSREMANPLNAIKHSAPAEPVAAAPAPEAAKEAPPKA